MKKVIALGLLALVGLTGCASDVDEIKTIESDVFGLDRKLTVYDFDGNVLEEYEGVIRVSGEEKPYLMVTIDGKRHVYYNIPVVVTEK